MNWILIIKQGGKGWRGKTRTEAENEEKEKKLKDFLKSKEVK